MPDRFDERETEARATLSAVRLDSFVAEPTDVDPFGASTLTWQASGPRDGWILELNGQAVERSGRTAVRPTFTKTYVLRARVGQLTRMLGQVTVQVDLRTCETVVAPVEAQFEQGLRQAIEESDHPMLRYRTRVEYRDGRPVDAGPTQPVVRVSSSGIDVEIALTIKINDAPNPSLDIKASFGFEVSYEGDPESQGRGRLVPVFRRLDADAGGGLSWAIGAFGGASLVGLPVTLGSIEEKAKEMIRRGAGRLASEITALARSGAPGLRLHSVRFTTGVPLVEVTACPASNERVPARRG